MLNGVKCRLRAVEPQDIDYIHRQENDPSVWAVSGTVAPYSRYAVENFVAEQQADIYSTRQLRMMVESVADARTVGMVDLFDFDPVNLRAGVGILICDAADRRRGYAAEALELLCGYAREVLRLHQLWCGVEASNRASLALFRRAGFVRTGRRRDWLLTAEGWRDEIEFSKILRSSDNYR